VVVAVVVLIRKGKYATFSPCLHRRPPASLQHTHTQEIHTFFLSNLFFNFFFLLRADIGN